MYHFATLFDRNYLLKGIALYRSLKRTCPTFMLHVLCMDDLTWDLLAAMRLSSVRLISIDEFEDDDLRAAKRTRSLVEYYWTCTPSLPLFVLRNNPDMDVISYLDADLLFFSDPNPIFEEFGEKSVMIIEHRFPKHLRYLEANGIYNVEMVTIRRDANGLSCLEWWRDRCLEWCYYRLQDGKLGDQKYLDDWPVRFENVHVLQHLGAGVAPWNVSQYEVTERDGHIWINDYPLIFYHFHQFHIFPNGKVFPASHVYCADRALVEPIYRRYIAEIEESIAMVRKVAPGFSDGITTTWRRVLIREAARRYMPQAAKLVFRRMGF